MPEKNPEDPKKKIKVRPHLPIRVTKRLPIKVKTTKAADEPAMSIFMRAVTPQPNESPERRKRREAFERKAKALRDRIANRDPALRTTTRLPYREPGDPIEHVEHTLFDRLFA